MDEKQLNGRYVYGIIDAGDSVNFGRIGIDESEVYTVPYSDISAVAHKCSAKGYASEDEKVVIAHVQKHNNVVNNVFNKFDAVIPLRFNTIIKEESESDDTVRKWLAEQYSELKEKLSKLQGKQEYGVQVFIDTKIFLQKTFDESKTIFELKKKIESTQSPGSAYLYEQKLKRLAKEEAERVSKEIAENVCSSLRNHVIVAQVEKTRNEGEKKMLLNASCLVEKRNSEQFEKELEKISNDLNYLHIRVSGPWAPYSFV